MSRKIYIFVPFMSGFGGTETVIKNLFLEYTQKFPEDGNLKLISIGGYIDAKWIQNIKNKKVVKLSTNKLIRTFEYLIILPVFLLHEVRKIDDSSVVISTNPIIWMLLFWIKRIFHFHYKVASWYHYSLNQKPVKQFFLKSADVYLAISAGVSDQMKQQGIDEHKIKIIYNPVIKNKYVVKRSTKSGEIHFIYVGRVMLDGQKNLREMIDSLANLNISWVLDIFGAGEVTKVKEYIRGKNLSGKVFFKGFKPNVWSSISEADYLLLSSKYEGFGMVLAEAISVGIPVISYNCEVGPADIVNDENGFLVNECNEVGLTKVLKKASREVYRFTDVKQIKNSISFFYGERYLTSFLEAVFD